MKAARPVDWHPAAIAEARAAFVWYSERSTTAASAFVEELDRAVELVGEAPARRPVWDHGTRRMPLWRFPFLVVYREVGNRIEVIAVAHGRRRPGYWHGR